MSTPHNYKNINSYLKRNPGLKKVIGDLIHFSNNTQKYDLLQNLHDSHLKNICKKEIKNWDTKNMTYQDFVSSNKYFSELKKRER